MSKPCTKCNIRKPLEDFYKQLKRKDGRSSHCKTCRAATLATWYAANKERKTATSSAYYVTNKDNPGYKERQAAILAAWQKANPEKCRAHSAKRRTAKLQRRPPWSETEEITAFYKACPEGYHVDHIIPLQGRNVSGLHVLSNLQYLTKSENCRKHNKFDWRKFNGFTNKGGKK